MPTRPAILLTGARQTGKTSLLKHLFREAEQITFDRVQHAQAAEENPQRFLQQRSGQSILDEIQYVPSLFRELKIAIDNNRNEFGKWLLTGSQRFSLMQNVTESLAGRVVVFHLETLSAQELKNSSQISDTELENYIWKGGYPELWANPNIDATLFFDSYVQTYLERDVRAIINVANLRDFQRFLIACASRAGGLVNYSDLSRDVGISPNTAKAWMSVLETSGVIYLLSPYYRNLGKRLAKAPKLYFADHGLLSHLISVRDLKTWGNHIQKGALWENLVFSELIKVRGIKPGLNLFYYRDQNSVEIDFIIDDQNTIELIEAKAGENVSREKLNFWKVAPLFSKQQVTNTVYCSVPEEKAIWLDDYKIQNPLFGLTLSARSTT